MLGSALLVVCACGGKCSLKANYFDLEDVTGFSGVSLDLPPVPWQNQAKYYGQGRCFHFLLKIPPSLILAIESIFAVTDSLFRECTGLTWHEHASEFRKSYSPSKTKGVKWSAQEITTSSSAPLLVELLSIIFALYAGLPGAIFCLNFSQFTL